MSFSRRLLGRSKANAAPKLNREAAPSPVPSARCSEHRTSTPDPAVKRVAIACPSEVERSIDSSSINDEEDNGEVQYPLFRTEFSAVKDGLVEVGMSVHETLWRNPDDRKDTRIMYHLKPELPHDSSASLRRRSSKSTAARVVAKQLFVLLADGLLLQYPDAGARNRSPDRELQLTSESVAFATDFIPGRPYVVHIALSAQQVGKIVAPSRGWLARFNKPNVPPRAAITGLFLVLSGPEEMEAWLSALRGVIKQLSPQDRRIASSQRPTTSCMHKPHRTRSRGDRIQQNGDSSSKTRRSGSEGGFSQLDRPETLSENFSHPRDSLGHRSTSSRRQSALRHSMEQLDRYSLASTATGSVNADYQAQLNQLRSSRTSTALTMDTIFTVDEPDVEEDDVDVSLASPAESSFRRSDSIKTRVISLEAQPTVRPVLPQEKGEEVGARVEFVALSTIPASSPPRRSLSCASSAPDLRNVLRHTSKSVSRTFAPPAIPEDSECLASSTDNTASVDSPPRRPSSDPTDRHSNSSRGSMLSNTNSFNRKPLQPLRLPIRVSSSPSLLQMAQSASSRGQALSRSRTCRGGTGWRPGTPHEARELRYPHIRSRTSSISRTSHISLSQVAESADGRVERPASAAAGDRPVPSLKRPSSVQVRSSYAPFLCSIRNESAARGSQHSALRSSKSTVSVPATMWERGIPNWAKAEQLVKRTSMPSEDLTRVKPLTKSSSHSLRSQSQQLAPRRPKSRMSILDFDCGHSLLDLGPAAPPPKGPLPPPPPPKYPPPAIPLPRPPTSSTLAESVISDWASARSSHTSEVDYICKEPPDSGVVLTT